MGRYVLTCKAEADLFAIYRYSHLTYGEQQADFYVSSLKQKCQFLAEYPLLDRVREEFTPPVRIHGHERHLIIYLVEPDHIVIIRFLHDRTNIQQHIKSDNDD